jgi:pimeloyl-ACP methyl ester carboxylesterase
VEPRPDRHDPGAEFVLIENGSHFSMIEDAQVLRDRVVPWLRKSM